MVILNRVLFCFLITIIFNSCNDSCCSNLILINPEVKLDKIKLGERKEIIFYIVNKGNKDLKIKNIIPECDCTVTKVNKNEIGPNDTALIYTSYTPTSVGQDMQLISIQSNSEKSPTVGKIFANVVE